MNRNDLRVLLGTLPKQDLINYAMKASIAVQELQQDRVRLAAVVTEVNQKSDQALKELEAIRLDLQGAA